MRFINLSDTDIHVFQCLYDVLAVSAASGPILLLEQPREQVVIGRKAIMEECVHLDFCRTNGIPIIRTPSPHNRSMVSYEQALKGMVAISLESPLIAGAAEGKSLIVKSLVASVNNLGLSASYLPKSNNITVGGRKVSAIISWVSHNILLFGFSLLLDFDYDRAEQTIISEKNMRESLTTIRKESGRDVTIEEVKTALKQGFSSVLKIELIDDELTEKETKKAEEAGEKYLSESWIKYGRWSPVKDYGQR
ncbi:Octanoyltransferase LipM [subsurface metagenome]